MGKRRRPNRDQRPAMRRIEGMIAGLGAGSADDALREAMRREFPESTTRWFLPPDVPRVFVDHATRLAASAREMERRYREEAAEAEERCPQCYLLTGGNPHTCDNPS